MIKFFSCLTILLVSLYIYIYMFIIYELLIKHSKELDIQIQTIIYLFKKE